MSKSKYHSHEEIWNFIKANEIATEDEMMLVCQIAGFTPETLNRLIFVRTEYHDMDQCVECEPNIYHYNEEY